MKSPSSIPTHTLSHPLGHKNFAIVDVTIVNGEQYLDTYGPTYHECSFTSDRKKAFIDYEHRQLNRLDTVKELYPKSKFEVRQIKQKGNPRA